MMDLTLESLTLPTSSGPLMLPGNLLNFFHAIHSPTLLDDSQKMTLLITVQSSRLHR